MKKVVIANISRQTTPSNSECRNGWKTDATLCAISRHVAAAPRKQARCQLWPWPVGAAAEGTNLKRTGDKTWEEAGA